MRVIAVVRDRDKAARLLPQDVEVREAELGDRDALARSFADVDAVVANAALISFRSPRRTMRTNVDGTRNTFEAIAGAGVQRAVFVSSVAAYRASSALIDETGPLRAPGMDSLLNAYGVSKAVGESVAGAISDRAGIALTCFRPCGITGPEDPLLWPIVERVMRVPIVPFPAYTTIGLVHAADVADAIVTALEKPERTAGKTYNLQGHTLTLWELADAWRRAGGRSPRLRIPVPLPVALRYDDSRARRELDWTPRSLDAILQETIAARRGSQLAG